MMNKLKYISAIMLVLLLTLQSCIDLEHVNTFSQTCINLLETYSKIEYSFSKSYKNYTVGIVLPQSKGVMKENKIELTYPRSSNDEVQLNQKADQAISYFINTLTAYFEGISQISSKDFVNYGFDNLASNLKSDGTIKSKLSLTDDKIDAGSKIAKTFADEIMGKYREKKLREILIKKENDVSLSIDALINSLDLLKKNLISDTAIVDGAYQLIFANPSIDFSHKILWQLEYNKTRAYLQTELGKIELLIKGLKRIRQGHLDLVSELKKNKLNEDVVVQLLKKYSTEVFSIEEQIRIISK